MNQILDILLPPSCLICHKILGSKHAVQQLCRRCLADIMPMDLSEKLEENSKHYYLGTYRGKLRQAIKRIKYHRIHSLIPHLGKLLALTVPDPLFTDWEMIVPIPIRFSSYYKRGFHQTLLLGKSLKQELDLHIPIVHALGQRRWVKHQTYLKKRDRALNMKDVFYLREEVFDRRILLVDDVVTTGSTIMEAKKILMEGGADSVDFAYIARAPHWNLPKNHV